MLVGLTGGIGSGKSAVAALLAERGARVVDADAVAREVVARDSAGLRSIVDEFGPEVLGADGGLDRARLAEVVFTDAQARQRLNAIVHPLVAARTGSLLAQGDPEGVTVYDVPLLVEESVQDRHDFDLILVVEAPEAVRVQRLVRDRQMTEEQVRARMSTQATDEQRRTVADVVIMNEGSRAELTRAVEKVWLERIRPAILEPDTAT
ncbi:MAG: dephospho-CoA kinase [Geodermatophilaceae bacterium]|nr:dephospho-CoA kinase [Geodermatophilaceae bacterium]